jgi:hypothetical protein
MKTLMLRLWNLKVIRILCWCLVSLAVLTLLLTSWISWSGQRRWARIQQTLKLEGETLEFKKLMPPALPDEQNFAAIEPLREINVVEQNDESRGTPGEKRRALKALGLKLAANTFSADRRFAFAEKINFTELLEDLRKDKTLELPDGTADAAAAIRRALETSRPLLKLLAQAARTRPASEFVPALRDQSLPTDLFTLHLPHYAPARDASIALRLHGSVCVETGDSAAAVADALAIFGFAEAAGKEPFLLGYLVSASLHQQALDLVWSILAARSATEADLQLLQSALQRVDFEQALLNATRGELIAAISAINMMENHPAKNAGFLAFVNEQGVSPSPFARALVGWIPGGFYTHSKAAAAEVEWRHVIRPLKEGGLRAALAQKDEIFREIGTKSNWRAPDYILARLMLPAVGVVVQRGVYMETLRRQALIACALERHWLRSQTYPSALAELAPDFLTKVPGDVVDGREMRYQTSDDGRYRLWSIGFDGKDDHGDVNRLADAAGAGSIVKLDYKGDWAWRYPAPK